MRAAAVLFALLLVAPMALALDVPPLTGRVVDLGDVLGPATEAVLTNRLAAHEDSTSNQIVVLTIPSLDGEDLEAYATRVFRAWGLGQAGTNNGVLLLVAVADRELRIEVGYGLEGALTDATAGSIIRNEIVPRFRDGDFDAGVLAGVDSIVRAVKGEYQAPSSDQPPQGVMLAFLGLPLVLFLVIGTVRSLSHGSPNDIMGEVGGALLLGGFAALVGAGTLPGRWIMLGIAVLVAVTAFRIWLGRWAEAHPRWGPKRRHNRAKQQAFRAARARGASTVVVDGQSYAVPTGSSSSGGGGGFSGGGGSSGGGGASGSW